MIRTSRKSLPGWSQARRIGTARPSPKRTKGRGLICFRDRRVIVCVQREKGVSIRKERVELEKNPNNNRLKNRWR